MNRVLITGGTSGIGLELAKLLLRAGNQVGVVGLDPTHSASTERALRQIAPGFRVYTYDLADHDAIRACAAAAQRDFGDISILIHNAGYCTYETFEESSFLETERLIAVNFTSHILLTKLLLPKMIQNRRGEIINVSSISGEIVITPNAIYGAAKQAMISWSRALSYELQRFKITVKVFCPGRVNTNLYRHPSFLRRKIRPEMKSAISAEEAASRIFKRMQDGRRLVYHLDQKLRFISWCYRSIPFVESILFRRLMVSRIADHYSVDEAPATNPEAP